MATYEMEVALASEDVDRLNAAAERRGITPEEMAGVLARAELVHRMQLQHATGSVVPFRRRTD